MIHDFMVELVIFLIVCFIGYKLIMWLVSHSIANKISDKTLKFYKELLSDRTSFFSLSFDEGARANGSVHGSPDLARSLILNNDTQAKISIFTAIQKLNVTEDEFVNLVREQEIVYKEHLNCEDIKQTIIGLFGGGEDGAAAFLNNESQIKDAPNQFLIKAIRTIIIRHNRNDSFQIEEKELFCSPECQAAAIKYCTQSEFKEFLRVRQSFKEEIEK